MSEYRKVLKAYWGYDEFRPLQEEIIGSVGSGKDTLALMPTGGGKSLTFQVPALAMEGICLVVTPLIALMKDQVEGLQKMGIKAVAIHSGLTREEIDSALDNCVFGDYRFLYLSPERLSTRIFKARVQQMNVNLLAVDEAHCISQWGYDFRPSYLRISELRKLLPGVPVLALTATATPEVAEDIMEKLEFREKGLLRKSFERKNLVYVVRRTEDKNRELQKIVKGIDGSGIVYTRSRKKTREVADLLTAQGVAAAHYHAGLSHSQRAERQEAWQENSTRVMVATNAFGMGIDKPDVRFVVHMDLPDSPEAYFQEAGRAGRDEQRSWAILLYSPADEKRIEKRISDTFPEIEYIKHLYHALFNYLQVPVGSGKGQRFDFILGEFIGRYRFSAITATSALHILSREGYFDITDEINNPSRVQFRVTRDDLYAFRVKNEKFSRFINVLLRSYSGLFSQYVPVDEHLLARRASMSRDEVYTYLAALSAQRVINYIPRKKNPVITLLEERLDEKNVLVTPDLYRFRKERFIERVHTMLDYARDERICRSRFLLSYFGEKTANACGMCDVCLEHQKKLPGKSTVIAVRNSIVELLGNGPMEIREIALSLELEQELIISVAEELIDSGILIRGSDLRLKIK
jgi:ATP-dependent DNA helicase RecQ